MMNSKSEQQPRRQLVFINSTNWTTRPVTTIFHWLETGAHSNSAKRSDSERTLVETMNGPNDSRTRRRSITNGNQFVSAQRRPLDGRPAHWTTGVVGGCSTSAMISSVVIVSEPRSEGVNLSGGLRANESDLWPNGARGRWSAIDTRLSCATQTTISAKNCSRARPFNRLISIALKLVILNSIR